MAEITSLLREMQLDPEAGLVPASGSVPICGSKPAAGNKMADAGNKEADADADADGSFTVTKAGTGNKEAARGFTKADAGNKEAARSVTSQIGVPKAGNKEAAGSFADFNGEIGVTKADVGNKKAAGKGVVTETDWLEFVFPKAPEGLKSKAAPTGTKEMVPKVIIDRLIKNPPLQKLPPITYSSDLHTMFPELRESYLSTMTRWNYLVDMHIDVLKQAAKQGFAELGVDFTDGVKKLFILPKADGM